MSRNAPLAAVAALVLFLPVSGCLDDEPENETYAEMGFDGTDWPDLHGAKVVILDHGAFQSVFDEAKGRFEALTNGTVEHIAAEDTGSAVNRAIREKDNPSFDIVYGIDNAYLGAAVAGGALQPYKPLLSNRINSSYVFFDVPGTDNETWWATPADHGYVGVNYDALSNFTMEDLYDLREHANEFVTQDPRTSSPGLGFLLATIATFPEGPGLYDWKDYWTDLLEGGLLLTADWGTAYATHFSGGYGQDLEGFVGDREIVTSYTTSAVYEFTSRAAPYNGLVLSPDSTFHQIETVAIAAHPDNLAAAQAWVEFCLTDMFQELHAPFNIVYPVVDSVSVDDVYLGLDPKAGIDFEPAEFDYPTLAANVEGWLVEWTEMYEEFQSGE